MRKKNLIFFFAFVIGMFLCVNDRFHPFRLRELSLENFSPELESVLRDWSESFLDFHPAWLLVKPELKAITEDQPMTLQVHWRPMQGALRLTATPVPIKMILNWRYTQFLTSDDGSVWSAEAWRKALSLEVPDAPTLDVGDSFPLLIGAASDKKARLRVDYHSLLDLRQRVMSLDGVSTEQLEIFRRGGDDLLRCIFVNDENKKRISFVGRFSGLDKTLGVVKELFNNKNMQNSFVDATYDDKIVVKQER